jgi:hypothetical protein
MRGLRGLVADAQDKVKMYSVKVHKVGSDILVACCDADLLGKRLRGDELEIHVSERFYGGEEVQEDMLLSLLKGATVANLIGDRAVSAAQRAGLIDEDGAAEVCGVKHAQLYLV